MKQFLFILLFMMSFTTFAKQDLYELIKEQNPQNLAYGVEIPDTPKFNDFSQVKAIGSQNYRHISLDPIVLYGDASDLWYYSDFAAEPFDGRLELLVVGEPLPTSTVTLIIAFLLGCVILYHKQYASLAQ